MAPRTETHVLRDIMRLDAEIHRMLAAWNTHDHPLDRQIVGGQLAQAWGRNSDLYAELRRVRAGAERMSHASVPTTAPADTARATQLLQRGALGATLAGHGASRRAALTRLAAARPARRGGGIYGTS